MYADNTTMSENVLFFLKLMGGVLAQTKKKQTLLKQMTSRFMYIRFLHLGWNFCCLQLQLLLYGCFQNIYTLSWCFGNSVSTDSLARDTGVSVSGDLCFTQP